MCLSPLVKAWTPVPRYLERLIVLPVRLFYTIGVLVSVQIAACLACLRRPVDAAWSDLCACSMLYFLCSGTNCSDGIKNQNETGIDCGGPCPPCRPPANCSDGIMNQ